MVKSFNTKNTVLVRNKATKRDKFTCKFYLKVNNYRKRFRKGKCRFSKIRKFNIQYSPHNTSQFLISNECKKSKIYDEDNEDDLVIYSGSMIGKSLLAQNSTFSDKESYSTWDEDYTNDVMSEASF